LPVSARSCLIGLTPWIALLNREKSSSCMSASAKGGQFTQLEANRARENARH
jgi:hypothetical protein